MAEDKILKKGLADLLKDNSLMQSVEILQKNNTNKTLIPLDLIVANPYQPRQTFDQDKLMELANSIKSIGVFTPILVRKKGDKYEIVAGERRYRASILAGKKDIPAVIDNFDDQQMSEIALVENIQRENLSPLEEARAYASLQATYNLTQQELAERVGKSRPYIANVLRLLHLQDNVQKELENNSLSFGHVRTLIGLSEEEVEVCLKEIKKKNLNVRETEEFVRSIKNKTKETSLEEKSKKISEKLNTKVKVSKNEIKIQYNSIEELEEILKKMKI